MIYLYPIHSYLSSLLHDHHYAKALSKQLQPLLHLLLVQKRFHPLRLAGLLLQTLRDVHQDLIRVSLRHQVALSVQRVPDLLHLTPLPHTHLGVATHQRVEEGLRLRPHAQLRSQNASQPLRLLSPRALLALHLDENGGFREIDGGVADLAEEDDVAVAALPELAEVLLPLALVGDAREHRVAE